MTCLSKYAVDWVSWLSVPKSERKLPTYDRSEGVWRVYEPGSERYVIVSEDEYTLAYDKINSRYRKD